MLVKNIVEEDFVNYKLPSMFIATCFCDWKCCIEQNLDISICQNASISKQRNILISDSEIYERYISNPITKAIVIGGLEPFRQYDDMYNLIELFRSNDCYDTYQRVVGFLVPSRAYSKDRFKEFTARKWYNYAQLQQE